MDYQPTAPVAAAAPIQVPAIPPVPTTWPGAFGLFKHAQEVVKVNLWPILGLSLLTVVLAAIDASQDRDTGNSGLALVARLLGLWVSLALVVAFIAGVKNEKLSFLTSLMQGGRFYLRSLVATILTALILAVSFLALIVPFFFVLPRLVLFNYYLVDRKVGTIESLNLSWKESKGHSLKIWGVLAVTILFLILCIVLVGFYLIFFYQAAFVILYFFITKNQLSTESATAPVQSAPGTFPQAPAASTPPVAPTVTNAAAPVTPQNPTPPPAV